MKGKIYNDNTPFQRPDGEDFYCPTIQHVTDYDDHFIARSYAYIYILRKDAIKAGFITATLRNWLAVRPAPGYSPAFYVGKVFGDLKGRFPDGSLIYTSDLRGEIDFHEFKLAFTINSVYKLPRQESFFS